MSIAKKNKGLTPEVECSYQQCFLLADSVLPTGSEVYFVRVRDQGPDYRYILFNHGSIIIKLTMFINIK